MFKFINCEKDCDRLCCNKEKRRKFMHSYCINGCCPNCENCATGCDVYANICGCNKIKEKDIN